MAGGLHALRREMHASVLQEGLAPEAPVVQSSSLGTAKLAEALIGKPVILKASLRPGPQGK
eukprot:3256436-Pyramimonas_sp.AAC.1